MTAQTLDRGIALLRILASAGLQGRRLIDLQRETGLTKPTIHRLLDTLKHHSYVEQVDNSKRYRLGPEIAILGFSAARQFFDLQQLSEPDMAELAARTGDTSFLVVRTGYETLCIDRKTGAYPVKAFTVDVGKRRPLGIGATGIALLAAMQPAQQKEALAAIAEEVGSFPASLADIRKAVENARRQGHALSDGTVLRGVRGLAMTIRYATGRVVAAIGIAAIAERVSEERIPTLLRDIRTSVATIERKLHAVERGQRPDQQSPIDARRE